MPCRYARAARSCLAVLSTAVLLGGCVDMYVTTREGFSPYMDGPEPVAPERSVVVLPDDLAEARLAVYRKVEDTLLHERVVLANNTALPGENVVALQTRYRGTPYRRFFSGPLRNPFTRESVQARVAEEFGGFDEISRPLDRTNRHGPYRYVIARDGGTSCVYAWQLIDSAAAITGTINTYAIDYRVCDRRRPAEELIALFDGVGLQPYL